MKSLFLLLISFSCFSQTAADREKIKAQSDLNQIATLKNKYKQYAESQKILIEKYKKDHPFVESKTNFLQYIEDGVPHFYSIDNQGSVQTLSANKLYLNGGLGLNVAGTDMTAGVWDGGQVRATHQELTGKVTLGPDVNPNLDNHATHVTGTIIARGISPIRRGFAYDGSVIAYNFTDDYLEMLAFAAGGYVTSNHSYGQTLQSTTTATFGSYNSRAVQIDEISNANPFYQIVNSAGNDRDTFSNAQVIAKGGYDLLRGFCNAKNGITVAAVNEVPNYLDNSSVVMSSFSNYGPTDDGRIKPDIAAKGVGVSSSGVSSDVSYSVLSGTSMATPAITGMILLLQKHFNNLNSSFMRASTVRGLVCHSAREAGSYPGPDYEFGWGLGNAELAATIISGRAISSLLEENTLNNGQVFTKPIATTTTQNISATICWTDPTGVANSATEIDNRSPRLINNLDLKILRNGVTYYPWKLNPDSPSEGATNFSDNNVDNVEKVEIINAPPGVYTIEVRHKGTLSGGSQVFSLIASGGTALSLNTRDYDLVDNIFIYPNPTTDVLNFSLKNDVVISSIKINDISGKEVFSNSNIIETAPIDVANLSSGVYFVTFTTDNNSVTKKFIKQ